VRRPLFGIVHHLFGRSIFLETNPFVASYVYGMERLGVWVSKAAFPSLLFAQHAERVEEKGSPGADLSTIVLITHPRRRRTAIPASDRRLRPVEEIQMCRPGSPCASLRAPAGPRCEAGGGG
jgi:hypothetical protein